MRCNIFTLTMRLPSGVVYSLHIPLFFFICGYVGYKLQSWNKIGQRFIQCMVPFFSAMLLSYTIHDFGHWSLAGLASYVWFVLRNPDYGLWFLWALFFIITIFLATRKIAARMRVNEIVAMVAVAGILNVIELVTHFDTFGYHWIAWYFMSFAIGAYWRKYMLKDRRQTRPCLSRVPSYFSSQSFSSVCTTKLLRSTVG